MTDPLLALLTSDDAFSQAMSDAADAPDGWDVTDTAPGDAVCPTCCDDVACTCPDVSDADLCVLYNVAMRRDDVALASLCFVSLTTGNPDTRVEAARAWCAMEERTQAARFRAEARDYGDPGLRSRGVRDMVRDGMARTDGRVTLCCECDRPHGPHPTEPRLSVQRCLCGFWGES